jgi:AI-2 transport system ATP-binding protein
MNENPIVELKNISKAFVGVPVLENVSFTIYAKTVHGLVGGNGAGKSTLMKILSGVYHPDSGEIWVKRNKERLKSPADAHVKGIYLVPQELSPFLYLTIEENILLGMNVKKSEYRGKIKTLMKALNCDFTLDQIGADLTIAKQQLVELIKGLIRESDVIILDEPTSALTSREANALFKTIKQLKDEKNIGFVYITHRLQELFDIVDKLTILKNGEIVSEGPIKNYTLENIIQTMVPKISENDVAKTEINIEEIEEEIEKSTIKKLKTQKFKDKKDKYVLEVENLAGKGFFDVSLKLRKGEILGLTGVVGAGRTEFAETLFGIRRKLSGKISLDGREINIKKPREAIKLGIVYLPEDRDLHGIFLGASIKENISSSILFKIFKLFLVEKKEKKLAIDFIKSLNIVSTGADQKIMYLSGGNRQKVVLGKWLAAIPKVLILDEPTRGIDANARKEIYVSIRKLAEEGVSILLISSDFEEVVTLCERVVVMYRGRTVTDISSPNITLENITFESFGYRA